MPYQPLAIDPGVNVQTTALLGGNSWNKSNLIRFKDGMLQKLGGCTRLTSDTFVGICRGLHAWASLVGVCYVGIGTNQRLEVFANGSITDITPIYRTANLATPFTTTAGSSIVSVADAGATVAVGDWVHIENMSFIDGVVLQGFYQVASIIGGGYTIDAGAPATAGVAGGGDVLAFTTTNLSHDVTITLGAYLFTDQQTITVFISTAVGGLTLQGNYVVTVTAGPVNTITAAAAATSSTTGSENGGNVRIVYLLPSAVETVATGSASYGGGTYGSGPYGISATTVYTNQLRQWSIDNWGEDMIACYTNGPIYLWAPPIALGNVATVITQAPAKNFGMFVGMPERQIISFGCTDPVTGNQDPMLIRWCDVDDYTDWTASATNQAGSFRIPRGSFIAGGLQGPGYALIWTDLDLWMMQYIGYPFVFSIRQVGWGCGLYSLRSAAELGPNIYWTSPNGFFQFDGQAVTPLRCLVWDQMFNNIDETYPDATFVGTNSHFNEFFVFYPTVGSGGVCTDYVKFQHLDGQWDYGETDLQRSAWIDQSCIPNPIAADYTGLLQEHEAGNDLDGVAMDAWASTGWLGVPDGAMFTYVQRFIPDFKLSSGANVQLTFSFVAYPNSTPTVLGPYAVTETTEYLPVEGRGRYVSIKVESVDTGSFWRLGKVEIEMVPAGEAR